MITTQQLTIEFSDVMERIEHLREELWDDFQGDDFDEWLRNMAADDSGTLQNAARELLSLGRLVHSANESNWKYGAPLIRDDHLVAFCKSEIWGIPNLPNYLVIDWPNTVGNFRGDFTEVDFDGTRYLVRK